MLASRVLDSSTAPSSSVDSKSVTVIAMRSRYSLRGSPQACGPMRDHWPRQYPPPDPSRRDVVLLRLRQETANLLQVLHDHEDRQALVDIRLDDTVKVLEAGALFDSEQHRVPARDLGVHDGSTAFHAFECSEAMLGRSPGHRVSRLDLLCPIDLERPEIVAKASSRSRTRRRACPCRRMQAASERGNRFEAVVDRHASRSRRTEPSASQRCRRQSPHAQVAGLPSAADRRVLPACL